MEKQFYNDAILVGLLIGLLVTGLIFVASASTEISIRVHGIWYWFVIRQMIFVAIGLVLASVIASIPSEMWRNTRFLMMLGAFIILSLVFVPLLGKTVNGSARWLDLGFISVQPSEFCKLLLVVYFAGFLAKTKDTLGESWASMVQPSLVIGFISVLMLLQPDFGTLMVILAAIMTMFFLAGLPWKFIITVFLAGLLIVTLLVIFEPYRIRRVLSIFDPWQDQYGSGYQIVQALIAIGRGGLFGTGLGTSVQKFFYLPEAHTDFLFAVIIEEIGGILGALLIFCFCFLIFRLFQLAKTALGQEMYFQAYIVYGAACIWAFQAIINFGVSLAILPTTGMPLPFISYGGSNIVTNCLFVGILLRIDFEVHRSIDMEFNQVRPVVRPRKQEQYI